MAVPTYALPEKKYTPHMVLKNLKSMDISQSKPANAVERAMTRIAHALVRRALAVSHLSPVLSCSRLRRRSVEVM